VEDTPTKAIKTKKDSSMVVGFKLLKEKKEIYFILRKQRSINDSALFILAG